MIRANERGRAVPSAGHSLAGKLIVFEGSDGTGKTTLARAVHDGLLARRTRCEQHAFPGAEDGTVGHLVYQLHHHPAKFRVNHITPASLQALHVAAHADAIERRILPALKSGICILLDRFWWSTWVYGLVAGVPAKVLNGLIDFERIVWGSTLPYAVVLVNRPGAGDPALDAEYRRLARREGRSVPVLRVRNDQGVDVARDEIIAALVSRHSPTVRRRRPT